EPTGDRQGRPRGAGVRRPAAPVRGSVAQDRDLGPDDGEEVEGEEQVGGDARGDLLTDDAYDDGLAAQGPVEDQQRADPVVTGDRLVALQLRVGRDAHHARRHREHLELDVGDARAEHAYRLGGGAGEVDDAPALERAPVVDAHDDAAPVLQVVDAHQRVEGQLAVGGGELGGVEHLAVGGAAAGEARPVPRGLALLHGEGRRLGLDGEGGGGGLGARDGGGAGGQGEGESEQREDGAPT